MIWLGFKTLPIAKLRKPGDWPERLKAKHVRELGESIGATAGVINHPVVEEGTLEIVAGADRIAAHEVRGLTEATVRLWQGTPAEKELIRAEENLRRRQDRDVWVARYVKATEQRQRELAAQAAAGEDVPDVEAGEDLTHEKLGNDLPHEKLDKSLPRRKGRPPTPKKAAREEVAAKLGTTVNAVAEAERRAARREQGPKEKPEKPPIDTHGLVVPAKVFEAAAKAAEAARAADGQLRALAKTLGTMEGVVPVSTMQAIWRHQQDLSDLVRQQAPASACPWCKCVPAITEDCIGCGGMGWVSKDKLAGAPGRLLVWAAGAEVQTRDGFQPLGEAAEGDWTEDL